MYPENPLPQDKIFIARQGIYTSPKELAIAGIPAVVVDPHNEVFSYWAKHSAGQTAVLVHIDNHSDMSDRAGPLEAYKDAKTYAKASLNIANFISAAMHYKIVGATYWVDPREDYIKAYGRVINGNHVNIPSLIEDKGVVKWDIAKVGSLYTHAEIIVEEDLIEDLSTKKEHPLILDIDLDAFDCVQDPTAIDFQIAELYQAKGWLGSKTAASYIDWAQRMDKTINLLSRLPRPNLITIARSQSPVIYTPAETVDEIEGTLLNRLQTLYS